MADSAVAVSAGTGTNIDTRTEGTNGNHRQVVVVGDPATNAGVAPVDATAGLKVDLGADNDVTVTNSTAANLKVDGSDVTQPVSGTVTANLSATDNAVLDAIESDTTAILADTAAIEVATEATQAALETVGGLVVNLGSNNDVTVSGTVDLGATDNAVLDTIDAVLDTINAKLVTGTDIGDVTINNASGASAVNIQDGGNSITVDGSLTVDLGANNDVTVTSGAITETNSAAIKTAVETIDNAISGSEMQVDVVGALPAGTNEIGKVDHAITGIGHGVKTVTMAGTDVALAASTACKRVTIQAQTDNTSLIAVGATGVDATIATGTGVVLYPGDVFELEIDNLADIYIDSLVNGEGVRYTYFT